MWEAAEEERLQHLEYFEEAEQSFASETCLVEGQHQHAWHDGPFECNCPIDDDNCYFNCNHVDHLCNPCGRRSHHSLIVLVILVTIVKRVALIAIMVSIAFMAIVMIMIRMIIALIMTASFIAIA